MLKVFFTLRTWEIGAKSNMTLIQLEDLALKTGHQINFRLGSDINSWKLKENLTVWLDLRRPHIFSTFRALSPIFRAKEPTSFSWLSSTGWMSPEGGSKTFFARKNRAMAETRATNRLRTLIRFIFSRWLLRAFTHVMSFVASLSVIGRHQSYLPNMTSKWAFGPFRKMLWVAKAKSKSEARQSLSVMCICNEKGVEYRNRI